MEMIGLNLELPHKNKSMHAHYSAYYTNETRAIVRKAFERDIEFGEYIFEENMKIALIGSRGIPACYSGFEQFYEQFAVRLAERGHDVTVYNRSHFIKDVKGGYKGVRIVSLPYPFTRAGLR